MFQTIRELPSPLSDVLVLAAFSVTLYVAFILAIYYGDWRTRRIYARIERSQLIRARIRNWSREQNALANRQRSWW